MNARVPKLSPPGTANAILVRADPPRGTNHMALAWGLLAAFVCLKLGAHFLTIWLTPFTLHRDEFLYLAMGRHLQLWGMDFPPAIAVLAKTARAVFGDNLLAVRFFPALAGTLVMVLAGLMAREFGGGRSAQALAMTCVLAGSLFLRSASLFHPVVLDQLCWSLALFALVKYARTQERRWWVLLGVAGGLGLLTKFSILFLAVGMLMGLALSQWRKSLATPWPYVAVLIALALGSPTLVGQLRLDFPVVTHMHDLRQQQLGRVTPIEFLLGQLEMLGPAVLVAAVGMVYLLRSERMRNCRVVGYSCIGAFLLLLVLHGKPYYIGPIYPVLFAAGAAALERVTRWLRLAAFGLVLVEGVVAVPFGLPILPPAAMARYAARLAPQSATRTNRGEFLPLPQDYADMIGWEDQVAAVAQVFKGLPPEKRSQATIVASNYGEAGALEFFGPRLGLPERILFPGSRTLWAPVGTPPEVVVAIGFSPEDGKRYFRDVRMVTRFDNPWMVSEERHRPIVIAETPLPDLRTAWFNSK